MTKYFKVENERIYELPADVVERKRGEWIVKKAPSHGYGDIYICPFCEGDVDCVPTNFCPWCGADMRADRKE